ncbi:MAG: hypothetical protein U0Y68_22560 [Blastocatellia bacterium]
MRKSEITIETRETWIIRDARPKHALPTLCPQCAALVSWLTPGDAAKITGQSLRQLFRRIGQGEVHFLENRLGQVLICVASLLQTSETGIGTDDDTSAPRDKV